MSSYIIDEIYALREFSMVENQEKMNVVTPCLLPFPCPWNERIFAIFRLFFSRIQIARLQIVLQPCLHFFEGLVHKNSWWVIAREKVEKKCITVFSETVARRERKMKPSHELTKEAFLFFLFAHGYLCHCEIFRKQINVKEGVEEKMQNGRKKPQNIPRNRNWRKKRGRARITFACAKKLLTNSFAFHSTGRSKTDLQIKYLLHFFLLATVCFCRNIFSSLRFGTMHNSVTMEF